jgi:hypothetical protein
MDKAALLDKINKGDLTPKGRPGAAQARVALAQLHAIEGMKDLDKKVAAKARKELLDVIGEYRRILRVKKMKRRKHTRG